MLSKILSDLRLAKIDSEKAFVLILKEFGTASWALSPEQSNMLEMAINGVVDSEVSVKEAQQIINEVF